MQHKKWLGLLAIILSVGIGLSVYQEYYIKNVDKVSITPTEISEDGVRYWRYRESIHEGANYLLNQVYEDGSYIYSYDPIKGEDRGGYNILRHAGTTFSLLEAYEMFWDEEMLDVAEENLDFLVRNLVPCPKLQSAECLSENDEIKLGGNGLAVLAMAKHAQLTKDLHLTERKTYLEHAQKMAEWIVSLQSDEGEFTVHKIDTEGSVSDFISGYYPGEALFALTRLSQVDGNRKWMEQAHLGANWIISIRDKDKLDTQLDHDHWLLYALNELHADSISKNDQQKRELYYNHAKRLTDIITASQHKNYVGTHEVWNGGYYAPPRSTPTATRTEGLNAARKIFLRENDSQYAEKAEKSIIAGIEFQLKTQITPERAKKIKSDEHSLGGFTSSLDEYDIRIDYVQHNISAIINYLYN